LNVKPALNASGTATVTVTVTDNGSNVAPNVNTVSTSFAINVIAVNDPPLVTGQDVVSVDEDNDFTIQVDHLTIIDHDDDTDFTITVSAGDNYTFSGTTISPNDNYFGTLTIPITVSDGSPPGTGFNFVLTV